MYCLSKQEKEKDNLTQMCKSPLLSNFFTSVSSHVLNLNFCNIFTIAILDSNNASLIPTQIRGPIPKGMYAYVGRLALFSSVNLQKKMQVSRTVN